MLLDSVRITGSAVVQIFILGAIGYFLVRKNILNQDGLGALSQLVIKVIFPVLIFSQLISNFSFSNYSDWWVFPLISACITLFGLLAGSLFLFFIKGKQHRIQFLSLVTFQNSGYLPLAMVAAMMPPEQASTVFIYIFMFLLGFDLIVWSAGVYMLTFVKNSKFELGSLFSPPVIANLVSLGLIFFGLSKFIPQTVLKPLDMIGSCTLPLAMFIVGGNIASIHLRHVDKKAVSLLVLAKLILMPAVGLGIIMLLKLPALIGLLILMQLAMPPATSLSVIIRHYKKEDLLISQGIFFGHIFSLITVPIFLSLYLIFIMVK